MESRDKIGCLIVLAFIGGYALLILYFNFFANQGPEWSRGDWDIVGHPVDVGNDACEMRMKCTPKREMTPGVHVRPDHLATARGSWGPNPYMKVEADPDRWCKAYPSESCSYCVDLTDCSDQHLDPHERRAKCCLP
jgi:hypothetical protein